MKIIKFISFIFFISLFLISNSFSKIVYIDLNKIMLDSDAGKSINIQIIEPKGGKNGYDRYLQ